MLTGQANNTTNDECEPEPTFSYTSKQIVPCKRTAKEVSFEWSHHRILSRTQKLKLHYYVSIVDSGSEMVDRLYRGKKKLAGRWP